MNKLTTRETEVLKLICQGYNNTEIAKDLIISKHTAKAHAVAVIKKLNAKNRTECAYLACKYNIINI